MVNGKTAHFPSRFHNVKKSNFLTTPVSQPCNCVKAHLSWGSTYDLLIASGLSVLQMLNSCYGYPIMSLLLFHLHIYLYGFTAAVTLWMLQTVWRWEQALLADKELNKIHKQSKITRSSRRNITEPSGKVFHNVTVHTRAHKGNEVSGDSCGKQDTPEWNQMTD